MEHDHRLRVFLRAIEQAAVHELLQRQLERRLAGHCFEQRNPDPAADHRGGLQERRGVPRQEVDPGGEHAFDRRRQSTLVPAGTELPTVLPGHERVRVAKRTEHLLSEQWITARPPFYERDELCRRRSAEDRLRESRNCGVVERSDLDRRRVRRNCPDLFLRFRPSDEHYQHGTPRGDPRKLGRQLERRSVDPVDVLHDQDERLRRRERADPIAKCVVQRASKRLGLELRDRIVLDG